MSNPMDVVQPPYSRMTDEQKLKILITELKRDENDMRFKPQDRFVFDVDIPWWVSVFSKMRYTLIIIPLIVCLILIFIVGVPTKVIKLSSIIMVIILYSLDLFDRKNPKESISIKDNTLLLDGGYAASQLEFLYRLSLLSESGYPVANLNKKIIIKSLFNFVLGTLLFSLIFSLFW